MLVSPGIASAAPKGCYYTDYHTYGPGGATAHCDSGNGQYQVYGVCQLEYWPFGSKFLEGPWVSPGRSHSTIDCPFAFKLNYAGIGLRN
ncbi:hypothetical protein ACFXO9_16190 [Nocardia tengchongensis]|uniref:hypothetical protein n=1 Tax=Nocardia tengchongensis TaxID=2055889 RepID=UPI0036B39016